MKYTRAPCFKKGSTRRAPPPALSRLFLYITPRVDCCSRPTAPRAMNKDYRRVPAPLGCASALYSSTYSDAQLRARARARAAALVLGN